MAKVDILKITPKKLYGIQSPLNGDYMVGDVVLNINPANGIYGWVCKSSGNPGEWGTLSLDGGNSASGKVTLIGNGSSISLEFNHNLGFVPSAVNVTPANETGGSVGVSHVRLFSQTGVIYLKSPVPEGESAEIYWMTTR